MKWIFFVVLSSISNGSKGQNLSKDDTFQAIFSKQERTELQVIFDFFNQAVCANEHKMNLNACYDQFLEELSNSEDLGSIILGIPYGEQLAMYEQLDSTTFSELWQFNKSWKLEKKGSVFDQLFDTRDKAADTTAEALKSMSYNQNGKYIQFLEELGKSNKAVQFYVESYKMNGSISPTMTASLLKKYEDYGFADIRVKFMIAMHYLTLNDTWFREEAY